MNNPHKIKLQIPAENIKER